MHKPFHETFDYLSGTSPEQRKRDDTVSPSIFERLAERLEKSGAEDVIQFGHKFVAHAADRESRQTLTGNQRGITLSKLERCQRAICEVAQFISAWLLWDSHHVILPTPQYDVLEHLDHRWLCPKDRDILRAFWRGHCAAIEEWAAASLSDLCGRISRDKFS